MNKVFLILSSADSVVHRELSFPYSFNSKTKGWMDQVRVILWGPTEKLILEDLEFQEEIRMLLDEGIEVYACKSCSDHFEVSKQLEEIGIDVRYVGSFVSDMLKEGWHQLTF